MSIQGKNYISGRWVNSHSAEIFESRNPANRDEVLGSIPSSDATDVEEAVQAARKAYPAWRATSRIKRGEVFDNFVQLVKKDHEELSRLMARECGKAINESRAEVTEGIYHEGH